MSVSTAKRRQAESKLNQVAEVSSALAVPLGGWIATFQQAVGMSTANLAERLGVSRNSVYEAIRGERSGSITLNRLDRIAGAMGGKVVYAIVPRTGQVEEIVMTRARKKARLIIRRARSHMALEGQTEGLRSQEEMIEELASEMVREMPRDFWK